MMLKKIFATLIVLSSLALTGFTMANHPKVEKYPDLTKTEEIIIKGKSDIRDVREIFGAPTVKGRTLNEDHLVLGYACCYNRAKKIIIFRCTVPQNKIILGKKNYC